MAETQSEKSVSLDDILRPVKQYWGFDELRPLQEEAIRAELAGRDSVVVMPTGGGKSLCYQVPPLLSERCDIVISPLISLMKDQVDGLRACGYPAAALHSGMPADVYDQTVQEMMAGEFRLVFLSPERILTPWFFGLAEQLDVQTFVIDEAHCVSHWGHDFRPEYRRLAELKKRFPTASVHAYTATATDRVRRDIAEQLNLRDPEMLVGNFDRPNLTYRIVPRVDAHAQTADVIRRHAKEAVIVYCLSRKDTETMAASLRHDGINARPYHAGMSADQRHRTQEAFADESLDVVTATVAFGMGIDRSNVRCVVHATMPKSIEHYQQETGRAGRDGLEAECVLFYSAADVMRWESLIRKSAEGSHDPEKVIQAHVKLLEHMRRYASVLKCRHKTLIEHFGQSYPKDNCGACDVCLNETEGAADATVTAQKIISCVARMESAFGVGYLADVLAGAAIARIIERGHDQLSTYGLLKETPRKAIVNWVYQIVEQGLLDRTADEYPVLHLNETSWEVMHGERRVMLLTPRVKAVRKTRAEAESWEGVDQDLFEHLRETRRDVALEESVPAYVVFSDAALRDMARAIPTTDTAFLSVHGVGQVKLKKYGARFMAEIRAYGVGNEVAE